MRPSSAQTSTLVSHFQCHNLHAFLISVHPHSLTPNSSPHCGGQIRPPRDVHVLTPSTCENVIWHSKRGFADVNKLRILRWGIAWLIWWSRYHYNGPYKKDPRGVRVTWESNMMTEWKWEWQILEMRKEVANQEIQVASRSWEGQGDEFSFRASRRSKPSEMEFGVLTSRIEKE